MNYTVANVVEMFHSGTSMINFKFEGCRTYVMLKDDQIEGAYSIYASKDMPTIVSSVSVAREYLKPDELLMSSNDLEDIAGHFLRMQSTHGQRKLVSPAIFAAAEYRPPQPPKTHTEVKVPIWVMGEVYKHLLEKNSIIPISAEEFVEHAILNHIRSGR